jgi:ketosteroid isomerase-like protein
LPRSGADPPADRALLDAETRLLELLRSGDLSGAASMLSDDFMITTAGWIFEPVDKETWLSQLSQHHLEEFTIALLSVRRYGDLAVVLATTDQRGSRDGETWDMTFRYTDVWRKAPSGWLLTTRHASGAARFDG